MPFAMNCPECSASLKIPDELEGKKIKCKSCGTPFRAEQEEEDEPPVKKKKPATKSKARRDEDDEERPSEARRSRSDEDDEDEEDDDEPRSRRSKKSAGKKKGPPVLLLGLLGGGFVVLIGVGILIYFLTRNGGGPLGGSASVSLPPGWEEINEKEGGFRVYMPGKPIRQQPPGRMPANARNAFRWASVTGDGVYSTQVAFVDLGDRSISTDPASLKATLKQVDPTALFFEKIAVEREIKVGGKPGIELELVNENPDFTDSTVMRLTASGGKFYVITLTEHERGKKDAKVRQTFFDSFRLQ